MFLAGDVNQRVLEGHDVGDGLPAVETLVGEIEIRVRVEAAAARQRLAGDVAVQRLGIAHGEQVVGFVVVVDLERRQVVSVRRGWLDLVVGNGDVIRADLGVVDGGHRR